MVHTDEANWEERLAHFGPLAAGAHKPNDKACVMEAVAFVAGEPWSDHPDCACPVISSFLRAWNDGLPDDDRDALLRPLVLRLIDTRGSAASALEALPEITDVAQVPSIRGLIEAARCDTDAAGAALSSTRKYLQQSALALVNRMIDAEEP